MRWSVAYSAVDDQADCAFEEELPYHDSSTDSASIADRDKNVSTTACDILLLKSGVLGHRREFSKDTSHFVLQLINSSGLGIDIAVREGG
jgi:hypothetical protein